MIQDLYTENYKILLHEFKQKERDICMNQKTILLRDVSSLQTDLQIQCNPMKVTVGSLFL